MPNGIKHIVVKSSRGESFRGVLARSSLTLREAPAIVSAIAAQARDGQDRGQVEHDGQLFVWHIEEIFEIRQWLDGTWYVMDVVEDMKTHNGYFTTRQEAEAELEGIFAGPVQAIDYCATNSRVA